MSGQQWQRAAHIDDLADGEGYESDLEIDGETVALFRIDEQVFALGTCSHEQGPLGQGMVDAGQVTCPWHSAKFEIRTGICLGGPTACRVDGSIQIGDADAGESIPACRTFAVKIVDGEVLVSGTAAAPPRRDDRFVAE
jgi:3-phenylpropionate/trans-cinnamate dioxygenase ferredoxin component